MNLMLYITRLLTILIFLQFYGNFCFSQTITNETKQRILAAIEGNDYNEKWRAITEIYFNKINELAPKVEEIIWKNDRKIAFTCLTTLAYLNSSNITELAHRFIEVADTMYQREPSFNDLLEMKYKAAEILIRQNDFSNTNLIFELIDREKPKVVTNVSIILSIIIENFPAFREIAKSELFRIANLTNENTESRWALYYIVKLFGDESLPLLVNTFKNHIEADNRFFALKELSKKHYSGLEQILKEQFIKDNELCYDIAATLLIDYDCPANYHFIITNLNQIKDTNEVKYISNLIIANYVVNNPVDDISILSMIDTLISYTNQTYQLNWIDQNTTAESISFLNEAKLYNTQNNLIKTVEQIKQFKNNIDYEYNDSINSTFHYVTKEAWIFLSKYANHLIFRLPFVPTTFHLNIKNNVNGIVEKNPTKAEYDSSSTVTLTAKPSPGYIFKEWTGDITGTNPTVSVVMNSNKNITAVFIPTASSGLTVKLVNSFGNLLTGGTLQYYESSWKNAVNNNDGTFTVNSTKPTISLRMTYEYGSQTKQNVPTGNGDVIFQTVKAQVKLQDSNGNTLDQGTVQYYAGAWRSFGTTTNGIAEKELLPANYSFRMTYAYASNDKKQDIVTDPNVIFQTVNVEVQLQNSLGNLIDQGTVQYYSGAWREFGTTSNGVVHKELLPNNYSFRMTYAFASTDKQQNLNDNHVVVFKTINTQVQLKNSLGSLIDGGSVQYYSGAWRTFGATTSGTAVKELLPGSYSFRMTHEYVSNDKKQDIAVNNTVEFSTVLCTIRVKDTQNQPVNNAQTSYYSGSWRVIGNTVNGEITKELLPAELTFRAKLGTKQVDKKQNIAENNEVEVILP